MSNVKALSEAQKKAYNKQPFTKCPWCGNNYLEIGSLHPYPDMSFRCTVRCMECNEEWNEVYKRVGIEDSISLKIYKGD